MEREKEREAQRGENGKSEAGISTDMSFSLK